MRAIGGTIGLKGRSATTPAPWASLDTRVVLIIIINTIVVARIIGNRKFIAGYG